MFLLACALPAQAETLEWEFQAPREEAAPDHSLQVDGGVSGGETLVLETGAGTHWRGAWAKSFEVEGGAHYRVIASRRFRGVAEPRRNIVVRLRWQDSEGNKVRWEDPAQSGYAVGSVPFAEPEFPRAPESRVEGEWAAFEEVLKSPAKAVQAVVELELRWEADARVEWSDVRLEKVAAPEPRLVNLATVHFQPREARDPREKPALFAPLIREAAEQKADLVVLPETLTYYSSGKAMTECAETIPGPSTDYFGGLAREHGLHLVVGLLERDGPAVYNVAVLIGPAGEVIGKYRKVALPRSEIEAGITPGVECPVFDTAIGKIGMMVCYDGFFPEVAHELSSNGAEIIAWPVWGCNPLLAASRACENHVYLVSSTYTDVDRDWMISGVWDHHGQVIAQAEEWGSVAVVEVDLNQQARWNSLGNFRAQLPSHRPVIKPLTEAVER